MNRQLLKPQAAQQKPCDLIPMKLVKQIKNIREAGSMTITLSDNTHDSIGEEIGKSRETVTRFVNDNGGLNPSAIARFFQASGNMALLQYIAFLCGCELVKIDVKAQRKAELLAELEALDKVA